MLRLAADQVVVLSRFGWRDPCEDEILKGHFEELEDFEMRTVEALDGFEN